VLLDADPSIAKQSFKDAKGQVETPLAYALYLKQPIVVAALIKAGVDVTAASAGIGTIELAVFGNDTESLRLLVEAGAEGTDTRFIVTNRGLCLSSSIRACCRASDPVAHTIR